jgi:hypothetical protein
MRPQLLFLEFNEINIESALFYCARGRMPHLQRLIDTVGWQTTTSERQYEHLEPWIQWVTAHTGLTLAEHGVFRLGDIVGRDLPQIWEQLEQRGLKVGAISPMNAEHRVRNPAFFVPDPWTATGITAPRRLERLYRAISQVVNDNAQAKLTPASAVALLAGALSYARPRNYFQYFAAALTSQQRPWRRAMVLDLLLSDVFIRQVRATQPHFASLFLNAGAHIQHHYMFCADSYAGPHRNPEWYVPRGVDPVREVYELYDRILGDIRAAFPLARVMVATGLHQVPHGEVTYYWRLKDHAAFLRQIGVEFERVDPRMSRDFLISCRDEEQAARAARVLQLAVAADGTPLFEVDNRGRDIFAMLVYAGPIERDFTFTIGSTVHRELHDNVAFVALKNGEHNGTGYFLDSGATKGSVPTEFPLAELPRRIMRALDVEPSASQTA